MPEVIILAGGMGTRLQSVIKDVPKPMAMVANKPFLYWLINYVSKFNPPKIIISTGHLSQTIKDFFGTAFGEITIEYSHEEYPLGTGGAIKKALHKCNTQNCIVLNGDSIFKIDFNSFFKFHKIHNSNFSMALKLVDNPYRYGTVELIKDRIIGFREKDNTLKKGLINTGIYLFSKNIYDLMPKDEKFSFEKDFLEKKLDFINFKGYISDGYFIDIGIPDDYKKANYEFPQIFN
ncbi:MAG: nucleotidyltransferase family protein [Bacteroidia bacterium]|nr:nucleotidyltransferase family protein [Bacteroidia bacterium]